MSCLKCEKSIIKTYKKLSEYNGKTYIKYIQDKNLKIVSQDDFNTLVEIGEIKKTQEYEIL